MLLSGIDALLLRHVVRLGCCVEHGRGRMSMIDRSGVHVESNREAANNARARAYFRLW